jgi:DNA-binding transcriptional LysR family regulator
MDRLDAMRLFVRLVECGSFSAVGREENIGQPTVSKQIAALEQYLGAHLVLRTSRQVSITDAGQTFYRAAKQLLDDYDTAESSVGERHHSPRGLVRLSVAPGHGRLCITPLLGGFFRRYPQVAVEITVSERTVDLIAEGIDLAIRHGTLADSSLTARKLPPTRMVLAASKEYVAAHGEPTRFADLDAHAGIVFTKGRERQPWVLKVARETVPYVPRGVLYTGDGEQIRAAVVAGLGIAQAPLWLFEEHVRSGKVKVLLPQLQPAMLPLHLVYAARRRVPTRVKVLIDYLLEACQAPARRES